jgi:hypothetical protein
MAPTLRYGSRVCVAAGVKAPDPGDLVLIYGNAGWIVHRIIHRCTISGTEHVFHRGDKEGRIGLCLGSSVCGQVVARLSDNTHIPALHEMPLAFQQRFRRARMRCRFYALCRGLAIRKTAARPGFGMAGLIADLLKRVLLRA